MISPFITNAANKRIIRKSGLFDADWYVRQNSDVIASGQDPLTHYVKHGASEMRDPSPLFDTRAYVSQFKSFDPKALNPLCHYLLVGERLGATPNRLFSPSTVRSILKRSVNDSLLTEVIARSDLAIVTSDEFSGLEHVQKHPYIRPLKMNPLWHALYTDETTALMPGEDGLSTGSELRVALLAQLKQAAVINGHWIYRVAGDDPHIVLENEDNNDFAPGHYRLSFNTMNSDRSFERAKIYFDYGAGFSESTAEPLIFRATSNKRIQADFGVMTNASSIRFDPMESSDGDTEYLSLRDIEVKPISRRTFYGSILNDLAPTPLKGARALTRLTLDTAIKGPSAAAKLLKQRHRAAQVNSHSYRPETMSYQDWIKAFDTIRKSDVAAIKDQISKLSDPPTISIILPVYNTDPRLLKECLNSVLSQFYPFWELCIADDCSTTPQTREIIAQYARNESRIKYVFRKENGHISKASNSALGLASGDWVALLDHDDVLPPHALYRVSQKIIENPQVKLIYSDEDKIDEQGNRCEPYFKSQWNERLFFEQNMISHLGVYHRKLIEQVGGFREGYEGAQDHDLALRCVERIRPHQILHIPEVLYHWRILPGSTAKQSSEKSYALTAAEKSITNAIERRQLKATVQADPKTSYCRLKYHLPEEAPLVSIIIPTRDGLDVLEPCIDSVSRLTDYQNFEILIVDNQSSDPETLSYFRKFEKNKTIRVLSYDQPFNYAAINNYAVKKCRGSLICFLNNDTEVISREWLTEMVAELHQRDVGAVGAKLLYTDNTVQHAGVILGVGTKDGVAGHGLLGISKSEGGYFSYAQLSREVSAVTAACLLTTRETFQEVGGFNELDLAVAFNDIDLCLKIREAGFKIVWTPHALLHHHESKSRGLEDTAEKQARFSNEVNYMLKTWGDALKHDPYYNPNLSLDETTYSLSRAPRHPFGGYKETYTSHHANHDDTPSPEG